MQLGALKDAVRQMAEAKEAAAAAQSVGLLQEQLQVPQGELRNHCGLAAAYIIMHAKAY